MPKYIFRDFFIPVEVKEYVPTKSIDKENIELSKDFLLYRCYNCFQTFFNLKVYGGVKDKSMVDYKYIRVYTPRKMQKGDYFLIHKDTLIKNSYIFNAYGHKLTYISEIAEIA